MPRKLHEVQESPTFFSMIDQDYPNWRTLYLMPRSSAQIGIPPMKISFNKKL